MTYDKYKIGENGRRFLEVMEVEYNSKPYNPNAVLEDISGGRESFRNSVFNSNFYLRAANEIMEKIFTSDEKEKLQDLIKVLEEKNAPLVASASSKVSEIMNEHESKALPINNTPKFDSRIPEEEEKVEK